MNKADAQHGVDLSVDLAGLKLANPIMTASGTSGYGQELVDFLDQRQLGAFVTKAVTVEPRKGNPPPRTVETAAGMLNAIGLANVGLERFVAEKVPLLPELGVPVIVNVAGHTRDDYITVCRRLDRIECIAGLELNVSCPNVADGLEFGTDPERLRDLVAAVRQEITNSLLIVKLSPNVTDITATAAAAVEGGADVLSLINTLQGMAINADTQRVMLANHFGGLSGPAVKPVALAMVYRVYAAVARDAGVPIIGMGGISNWRDAVEFVLAGATAVAVGTYLFVDPASILPIRDGLAEYLGERKLTSPTQLIGLAHAGPD
ncbi:MAG: dihydroorotate dehydrogenase [bacterium]|nr:dihydroorotate dehydrogenase [bacterium]